MEKTFGKLLTDALEAENMTRKALAGKLLVSVSTVSYYCNDKRIPPFPVVVKICKIFNLNLNDIYQIRTNDFSNDDIILMRKYHMLDDDGKEFVNRSIDLVLPGKNDK